jgi:hypothetical protein
VAPRIGVDRQRFHLRPSLGADEEAGAQNSGTSRRLAPATKVAMI